MVCPPLPPIFPFRFLTQQQFNKPKRALAAEIVPADRLDDFVRHLTQENEFNRPHRIPSLSYEHPLYNKDDGGYWKGAVWAPTNYMVLRGLSFNGYDDLAFEIGLNHLTNVVKIFEETGKLMLSADIHVLLSHTYIWFFFSGTVWENYAPEQIRPGYAKPYVYLRRVYIHPLLAYSSLLYIPYSDFVGWSGLGPVAVLFEYVFGIRAIVPCNTLIWRVSLLEAHGVQRYPFGKDKVNLYCAARSSQEEKPHIEIESSFALDVVIKWKGDKETKHFGPSKEPPHTV